MVKNLSSGATDRQVLLFVARDTANMVVPDYRNSQLVRVVAQFIEMEVVDLSINQSFTNSLLINPNPILLDHSFIIELGANNSLVYCQIIDNLRFEII